MLVAELVQKLSEHPQDAQVALIASPNGPSASLCIWVGQEFTQVMDDGA